MIQDLKLINRNPDDIINQTPFSGASDIDFDEYGRLVRCTSEEGIEQNLLKAILTEVQINNYGTSVIEILGKKNLSYVRAKLFIEITNSLSVLIDNQTKFLNQYQTYDKRNIIGKIVNCYSNPTGKTQYNINMTFQSLEDALIGNQNLVEKNLILSR